MGGACGKIPLFGGGTVGGVCSTSSDEDLLDLLFRSLPSLEGIGAILSCEKCLGTVLSPPVAASSLGSVLTWLDCESEAECISLLCIGDSIKPCFVLESQAMAASFPSPTSLCPADVTVPEELEVKDSKSSLYSAKLFAEANELEPPKNR